MSSFEIRDFRPARKTYPDSPASGEGGVTKKRPAEVSLEDFYAHMPSHRYLFVPTRDLWPANSVNALIPPIPLFDNRGHPLTDKKSGEQKKQSAAAFFVG
jgi:hypothetical protein